jgi:putative copper export protein
MTTLLSLIHGLDDIFTSCLIGSVVFYVCVASAGGDAAQSLMRSFKHKLSLLLLLTFVTSLFWMLFTAADMAESWTLADLWQAMSMTSFGHLWCLRIILLGVLVLVGPALLKTRLRSMLLLLILSGPPLISVLSGHAGSQTNNFGLRVVTDFAHALAIGVWAGGLWMLHSWLTARLDALAYNERASFLVITRFSHFSMVSTAVIVVTGLLTAYLNGVSFMNPWSSVYGQLVLGKIFFFSLAMLAAAFNQFLHLRNWKIENEIQTVRAIRREVKIEFALITIVFLIAGFLSRTSLPAIVVG